jgi:hypothetical protein
MVKQEMSDWQHVNAVGAALAGGAAQQYSSARQHVDALTPHQLLILHKKLTGKAVRNLPASIAEDLQYLSPAQLTRLEKYVHKKISTVPSQQYANLLATEKKVGPLIHRLDTRTEPETMKNIIRDQIIGHYKNLSLAQYKRLSDKLKQKELSEAQTEKIKREMERHQAALRKIAARS